MSGRDTAESVVVLKDLPEINMTQPPERADVA